MSKYRMPVFPRVRFCFIAFFWCFSAMRLQKQYKNLLKKFAENILQKKSTKNLKPNFSRFCLYHVYMAFLGEGSSKTPFKTNITHKNDPCLFLASDPPTHHGGARFCFAGPLVFFLV
jgi:hypothetical protein